MGFLKNLIFEDPSNGGSQKKAKKEEAVAFPKSENIFAKMPTETAPVTAPVIATTSEGLNCAPHIDNVIDLYEKGFDALNKDGYDFYEYYKAILQAGPDNAAVYPMALTMAKAMDASVSKQSLLQQSAHYVEEIEKVYRNYVTQGEIKQNELGSKKSKEESSLKTRLTAAEDALKVAQNQVNELKIQIGAIDNKYAPQLNDITCKMQANDLAKTEILNSIEKVTNGINKNL